MSISLLLSLCLGWAAAQDLCMSSQFRAPGDYILGGLFSFTVLTNATIRTQPDIYRCDRLYAAGLVWALGMKFAVEEINNSSELLPGIQLGYDIYDTCMEPVVALQPSLLFITKNDTGSIGVLCNYTDYQTQVTAIIGPHNSELCMVTAKLFGFFLIPQVSYGATTEAMNNEELYPSFFRTVPSDKSQLEAMIHVLLTFKWNWIATIGSDDDYGREGISLLSYMVTSHSICIGYEGLIPADMSDPDVPKKMQRVIHAINETQVNVIVVFSNDRPVRALFKECFQLEFGKKVWLATEAWVMSDVVTNLKDIRAIGTVIGFIIKGKKVPRFNTYVANLLEMTQQESFCRASKEQADKLGSSILGPQCPLCDFISRRNLTAVLDHRQTFAVYTAVYSVAHALHKVLRCQGKMCRKRSVKPWELLEAMKIVQFDIGDRTFQFDQYRSMNTGYEVIGWGWREARLEFVTLGDFHGSLSMNKSLVQFHTEDQKAPLSSCLTTCSEGQIRRVKGFHLCCYDCIDCEPGTYRNSQEDLTCTTCPEDQWSPKHSTRCYDRSEKYFFWLEPLAVALLGLLLLAFGLTSLAGVLFWRNLHTPAVQAAGGAMSLLALLGLALLCASTVLYVGRPGPTICKMQQPTFALCLNLCFATILVKALQIVLWHDFADSRKNVIHTLARRRPWAIVATSFLLESSFCFWYIYGHPPTVFKNYKLLPTQVLVCCQIQSWVAFIAIHGFNSLLAFVSFLCTFMVQTSAKKYNVARGVAFAMITYFITLIAFIPTYATVGQEHQPATQMGGILLCTLGLLVTFYLPNCYIIWFKPDWNTADRFLDYTKEGLQEKESQD
ncbi:hypothetical protein lerEdw1_019708 [Lerista edwardsae]|nr:hypothetical protein lerEdw1_019708 [Lerista edwardsae]